MSHPALTFVPKRPGWRQLALVMCLALAASPGRANLIGDWGTIEAGSDVSFSFFPSDASTNFTDQYSFSLAASTDIAYLTESFLAVCTRGCGNPVLEFGIYDASGGLLDSTGSVTLGPGDYVFQIKGTGMGSGNLAGSGGIINFASAPTEIVSPAPEPAAWLMLLAGLITLGAVFGRGKRGAA